jgi:hypothetical protein
MRTPAGKKVFTALGALSHAAAKMASSPAPAKTRCQMNDAGTRSPIGVSAMNFQENSFPVSIRTLTE